jgi:hypothetical protein
MTVIIGVDPHKATHTAVAIDGDEQPLARLDVVADRSQTQRLLAWAAPFAERRYARAHRAASTRPDTGLDTKRLRFGVADAARRSAPIDGSRVPPAQRG